MTTLRTSQVIFVGGIKGGVGKSLVSRAFVDYMIEKAYPYFLVDADSEIRDVQKYYPDARVLTFSDDPKRMLEPDWIIAQAKQSPGHTLIVNLPGNAYEPLKEWLKIQIGQALPPVNDGSSQCAESLRARNGLPQFVHLFVTDGSWSSIQMFRESIRDLGDCLPHVLVRNNGSNRSAYGWDHVNEALPILAKTIKDYQVLDVEFPDIYAPVLFHIDKQVDMVCDDDGNPLADDNGDYQYYWGDDKDRPPSRGYRFKDAIDHPDSMIGIRFYHQLPNIYAFFDGLFSNCAYLWSPSGDDGASVIESDPFQVPIASSKVLPLDQLPKALKAGIKKMTSQLKLDSSTVIGAIAQLPRSGENLRSSFSAYLGRDELPDAISEDVLKNTRDEYIRVTEDQVAA
ncbi:MAG: hypothetical protein AAGD25_15230 [Cyanobacteria bacterium P01_F01_bin.150]